ncbi:MAG: putative acetyltransferase [Deltaproteobacteria bacterium ADurb.Bin510]|jgi:ribosomal protein S18 acetylase RimI-like enzyme|nr:MAG: putative acetyltransferase [Deltaproteobacteria bacterium ADurb.Bin510]
MLNMKAICPEPSCAIRPATRADLPELQTMLSALVAELAATGEDYLQELDAHWQDEVQLKLRLALESPDGALLIRPAAGFIGLSSARPFISCGLVRQVGYIELCWVAPEFRRSGLGRQLVLAAEGWFAARGLDYVELHYLNASQTAAGFWQACGYAPFRQACRRRLDARH